VRRKSGAAGFTLLEIVVAVAILSMGMAVALQIFSGGLKNIRRIDLAHQAMRHAENVMNDILSNQDIRMPAAMSGNLDEEFTYTASVDYWQEPQDRVSLNIVDPGVYLLKVTVDVHYKNVPDGKHYRTVCLKAVSERQEPFSPLGGPGDAIRQLFGGSQ
jgi:prepilin-type N-terminal cleavage/methylation domain-containing protein